MSIGQLSIFQENLGVFGEPEHDARSQKQFSATAIGGERFSIFHLREAGSFEGNTSAVDKDRSLNEGDQARPRAYHLLSR